MMEGVDMDNVEKAMQRLRTNEALEEENTKLKYSIQELAEALGNAANDLMMRKTANRYRGLSQQYLNNNE